MYLVNKYCRIAKSVNYTIARGYVSTAVAAEIAECGLLRGI
jgi:hypothetical protein